MRKIERRGAPQGSFSPALSGAEGFRILLMDGHVLAEGDGGALAPQTRCIQRHSSRAAWYSSTIDW